jgi:putative tricarboxylic transport membrane protein
MSADEHRELTRQSVWQVLTHKHVLSGLMFSGIAILGLWLSRDYPIGTALRMGTGYVPRLLCWILLGLGCLILVQGLRDSRFSREVGSHATWDWRAPLFVTGSLIVFGVALERLGLVISIFLLIGIGALASRTLRPLETLTAALVLIVLSWAIFIVGLGLTIPVWPEW